MRKKEAKKFKAIRVSEAIHKEAKAKAEANNYTLETYIKLLVANDKLD